jgi:hypothetical protein
MAETQAKGEVAPGARLDALRESGADRADPVRFAYLAALARRAADQAESIRRLLSARIMREADALAARHCLPTAGTAGHAEAPANSPLAALLSYIGEHAATPPTASQPSSALGPAPHRGPEVRDPQAAELKSVAYFRETWSLLYAEQQLTQTLAQAPENAGPMNSQHLVLRALQLMRDLSPDYLKGFMSYVDTLIWLEHASSVKPKADRPPAGEGEKR